MFLGITEKVLKDPRRWILSLVVLTLVLGYGMRFLTADTDVTNDLPRRIEAKRLYDQIEEMFPAKEMVIVGIEDPGLFTVDGVARLVRLTHRFESLDVIQSVMGPTNARIIEAADDGIVVREAADPLPMTRADVEAFEQDLLDQPMLRGAIVSDDGKAVAMLLFIRAGVREADAAEQVIAIADDGEANEGFTIHVAGRAAATYWSKIMMGRDMGMLSGAALAIVILLLLVSFRSARGVLLPLTVVVSSVVWTLGLMGYLGHPITHSTEVLPILLIAIGVADGIHILKGYYARARRGGTARDIVFDTMADLNRPVILTSITTACGFLALNTSGIESIMTLGFFTAFGVIVAMVFSLVLIPAALALLEPPATSSGAAENRRGRFAAVELVAERYGAFLVRRKGAVAGGVGVVIVLAIIGATMVPVEMSTISNFPSDHPLRKATDMINRHFGGTTSLVVVVEGGEPDAIKDPAVLEKMDKLEEYLRATPHVGSVQSITGFIKQLHRVMHGDTDSAYRLPHELEEEKGFDYVEVDGKEVAKEVTFTVPGKELVAQYLALYEMSGKPDDFANLVTYDYSTAKMNVLIDSDRASVLNALVADVRAFIADNFGDVKAELTGMAELLRAVNQMVIRGQGWSILSSLILVWIVTSLMFRSSILGVFSTLPLFFSLFLNFGVMGMGGIALNVMTMATSSVAVGVGIDYAIHFVHRYQHERLSGLDFETAVPATMRASGVAIMLNAVTVAAGFAALTFSEFHGVAEMGFLIALTMLTSAFAALTILPVVFVMFRPAAFTRAARARDLKQGE